MSPLPAAIQVTSGHIATGTARDCSRCPVAIALTEACRDFPGFLYAQAEPDELVVVAGFDMHTARTPDTAAAFMNAFDGHQDVGPFEFRITWEGPGTA
jgi:hypothetical protein